MQLRHELKEIHAHGEEPFPQFDHVQTPCAGLGLADGGLNTAQMLGQIALSELAMLAISPQESEEELV